MEDELLVVTYLLLTFYWSLSKVTKAYLRIVNDFLHVSS